MPLKVDRSTMLEHKSWLVCLYFISFCLYMFVLKCPQLRFSLSQTDDIIESSVISDSFTISKRCWNGKLFAILVDYLLWRSKMK